MTSQINISLFCLLTAVPGLLFGIQQAVPLPKDDLPKEMNLTKIPLGLPAKRPIPTTNPLSEQRVRLGRKLFFDPILSGDGSVSCASCHQPRHGFATPEKLAVGIGGKRGTRNSPSLLNVAYGSRFFWDGRAGSLEAQAVQPITNPLEMGANAADVLKRLQDNPAYVREFQFAFPGKKITLDHIALSLSAFQRTLLSGNSRVDQFHAANASALSTEERQGMWIFESRGNCWKCHSGSLFTDDRFHNTGVSWGKGDLGRFDVTRQDKDKGAFHTPTLRNISQTAPYMHDGSLATLEEVVRFYNRGGQANPNLDPVMRPLNLTDQEVGNLVAFLKALTGQ